MNATDRWQHALQLQQSGDLTQAELDYQQIIESDPGNAEAWEKLQDANRTQLVVPLWSVTRLYQASFQLIAERVPMPGTR